MGASCCMANTQVLSNLDCYRVILFSFPILSRGSCHCFSLLLPSFLWLSLFKNSLLILAILLIFFFLNSSLLECIALGGGDPKVWATCLGNLFPAGLYPIVLHRGDLWRSRILLSWIYWLWLLNSLIHIFSMILPMLSNFLGNIMEYI